MKNNLINKGIILCILMLMIATSFIPCISGMIKINAKPLVITVSQSGDNVKITYEINDFEKIPVFIDGSRFYRILVGEEPNLLLEGVPDVPVICRSIIVPDTAKMEISLSSCSFVDFEGIDIVPSKGNLLRTVNPDDVAYVFGDVYGVDGWFPENICALREPYVLRDYRAQVVEVYPVQYNPVKKVMRVYNDISVEVYPNGIDIVNIIDRNNLREKIDSDFKEIYTNQFINYGKLGRYDPVGEQGNLLIIAYDDFMDEMEPFVEWKTIQGIPTEIVEVSEIGDANAIKTYITDYYNDNGLTFVLLVGDAAQVPSLNAGYSASDPSYTYIVGNDHYPDLFVGRFSAQNSEQLNTQIERSIEYERDPQIDVEWYHKGIGIGSDQGAGAGDEGQADWDHIRILRTLLMDYTYTDVNEFYDGSHGEEDAAGDPTPSMISEALNDGRSIINYCGHGWPQGWGTSGFSNTDIDNLVNDNMLPYVTSVACNNGEFNNYDACFCEAWLRATNNGEPAGAIVATGSSVSMSWAPPMDAQDEFVDLIVETYEDNIKHTFGGIHYNGLMHMNDDYGSGGFSETDYWHLFGDPSLQIRTDTPEEMTVVRDEKIDEGATSYEVFAEVENALCAISRNGEFLGSAYTDASGNTIIELNEPITGEEPITLVITAYNKMPYIAEIPVITNDPPQTPGKPTGSSTGKPGAYLSYSTSTTDPEGNQIYYMWDWGDGNQSVWMGPFNSGVTANAGWTYSEKGTYEIKVKAKDTEDDESDWSEPLQISITKPRSMHNLFIQNLFNRYSDLLKILMILFDKIIK